MPKLLVRNDTSQLWETRPRFMIPDGRIKSPRDKRSQIEYLRDLLDKQWEVVREGIIADALGMND
jgi:hypothetical protein